MAQQIKTLQPAAARRRKGYGIRRFKKELPYHFMIWLAMVFALIFNYIPLGGLMIAFKDYRMRDGILGSAWVGLKHFQNILSDFYMGNAVMNTIGLSLLSILISVPVTLIFAILIKELSNTALKRTVQTISYLPHFISWAIMAVLLDNFLNVNDGIINIVIKALGGEPVHFLGSKNLYWPLILIVDRWKETGWSAIIYLAVMSGIDESLYEAAKIDGAGRLARIRYITLPSLSNIVAIMLILDMGSMAGTGFDQAYFLSNPLNFERSNVLSYYVYEIGLRKGNFSYSTAIGLITSTVSAALMLTANGLAKKINGSGLF